MSSASSDRSAVLAAQLIARDGYRWREAFDTVFAETGERPPEESVARELRRWYAIFRPIDHRRSLRRKRTAALGLMTFLEESLGATPKLVGRVLDGAASDDAVAEVVLDTDDEKAPVLALLNAGFQIEELKPQNGETALLAVDMPEDPVLLAVWTRPRPRRPQRRPDEKQHPLESIGEISAALLSVLLVHDEGFERDGLA